MTAKHSISFGYVSSKVLFVWYTLHCFIHGIENPLQSRQLKKCVKQLCGRCTHINDIASISQIYVELTKRRAQCVALQANALLRSSPQCSAVEHMYRQLRMFQKQWIDTIQYYSINKHNDESQTSQLWTVYVNHQMSKHQRPHTMSLNIPKQTHQLTQVWQHTLAESLNTHMHCLRVVICQSLKSVYCTILHPIMRLTICVIDHHTSAKHSVDIDVCNHHTVHDVVESATQSLKNRPHNECARFILLYNTQLIHPQTKIQHTSLRHNDRLVCIMMTHQDIQYWDTVLREFTLCLVQNNTLHARGMYTLCYNEFFDSSPSITTLVAQCKMDALQCIILRNYCHCVSWLYVMTERKRNQTLDMWLNIQCTLLSYSLWDDDAYYNEKVNWSCSIAKSVGTHHAAHQFEHYLFLFYFIFNTHRNVSSIYLYPSVC